MHKNNDNPWDWDQELRLEGWLDVLGKAAKGALGAVMGSKPSEPSEEVEKAPETKNKTTPDKNASDS